MPKVSSSTSSLRRNQACRQCRKKKLVSLSVTSDSVEDNLNSKEMRRCSEYVGPHCGTCVKTWRVRTSVPAPVGYVHHPEPDCTYDPSEGVQIAPVTADDPAEKIRILEAQIAELRNQLLKAHREHSRSASPNTSFRTSTPSTHNERREALARLSSEPLRIDIDHDSDMIQVIQPTPLTEVPPPDPYSQVLYTGWNPDLPDPATVLHLTEIFFSCDPCGSRVIHRSSFLASMSLPPTHPDHPHPALLHAICATASRWVSRDVTMGPDGQRRDKFAEFHARKARSYIDQTMTSGTSIFPVLQTCILLSWYFYTEGRWVEVWIFSGFQTRVAVPLRLNYPGTHTTDGLSTGSYLPPPANTRELECRRRTWWMAIMFDRIVSIGGWLHGIDVQDIGTELPLRAIDFEMEADVKNNPQHLWTDSMLTTHPSEYTDPFILLIKATMLFGRVTDFNVRSGLRNSGGLEKVANITSSPAFTALDQLVTHDFLASLPQAYKNCLGIGEQQDGNHLDTDLYLVHLLPHAATITLHNAHIDLSDQDNASAKRCLQAARSILRAYYLIAATSFDLTRLHPTVVICWYLAAVVQVQSCKRLIQLGDRESEANVWGEINLLRLAMLEYGLYSPIGIRQEKLLQGVLTEILHLTSTHNPLAVTMPLYPFSHARVFQNASRDTQMEDVPAGSHVAPLPSPPFHEDTDLVPTNSPSWSKPEDKAALYRQDNL